MRYLFTLSLLFIGMLSSFSTTTLGFDSFFSTNDHNHSPLVATFYIGTTPDLTLQDTMYSYDYTNNDTYSLSYTNTAEPSYADCPYADTTTAEASSGESAYQSSYDTQSDSFSSFSDDTCSQYSARDYDPHYYSSPIDHSNDSYAYPSSSGYTDSLPSLTTTQVKQQSPPPTPIQSTSEDRQALIQQNIQDSASYLKECVDTYREEIAENTCSQQEAARWQGRIQAVNESENNNYQFTTRLYSLSAQATDLLHTFSIDTALFTRGDGTAIQHCVQQEIVTLIDQTATIYYKTKHQSMGLFSQAIANLAHTTIQYNQAGYMKEALMVADCCWGLLDCALGIFEGGYDAVSDIGCSVGNALLHPIGAGTGLVYNTATAVWYMGKVLHEVCDITVECVVTPESGSDRLAQAIDNVGAVTGALWRQLSEMSPREATRAITKNVAKSLITKKCVGALQVFYKDAQVKLVKLAKKIKHSSKPIPVPAFAGCPEGYFANESTNILRLFQRNKNNKLSTRHCVSKTSNQLTKKANIKTENGIALKPALVEKNSNNIQWTSHGYKHFPQKNLCWKDIIKTTKHGFARYKPGIDIESLERLAWKNGYQSTNKLNWKVIKFDHTIGAKRGLETCYMRVEMSANTIHGHPITLEEYTELLT